MFPGRHTQGYGVLTEEVQGEFGLWENLVPEEVREGIGNAEKDGKELGFESADGGKRVQLCCSYIHQEGTSSKVQFHLSTMVRQYSVLASLSRTCRSTLWNLDLRRYMMLL